jgi:hypothetical protein
VRLKREEGEGVPPLVRKDPAAAAGKRTHRDKTAECEEEDATPDLLLKHPDATLTTYVLRQIKHLKHASEILAKHLKPL